MRLEVHRIWFFLKDIAGVFNSLRVLLWAVHHVLRLIILFR
jgi:hypothetical protein